MPLPRNPPHGGGVRGSVPMFSGSPELLVKCPECHAAPGSTCFQTSSWVSDPEHPAGGFFTKRRSVSHRGRKTVTEPAPVSLRGELRKQIRSIIMVKLSGSQRPAVRAWAGSIQRTEDELAAKLAELREMGDLS